MLTSLKILARSLKLRNSTFDIVHWNLGSKFFIWKLLVGYFHLSLEGLQLRLISKEEELKARAQSIHSIHTIEVHGLNKYVPGPYNATTIELFRKTRSFNCLLKSHWLGRHEELRQLFPSSKLKARAWEKRPEKLKLVSYCSLLT